MRDRDSVAFAARDIGNESRHTRQQIARALAALGREVRSDPRALETVGTVAGENLLPRQPFPFTPVMLAQPFIRYRIGKPKQPRRLARPAQW